MRSIPFFVFALFFLPAFLYGEMYEYHPSFSLGYGFNPYRPTSQYLPCIDTKNAEEVPLNTISANRTEVVMSLLKKREDFYRYTKISATVSGSYSFLKGSSSISSEEELTFHSDTLNWIIAFKTDYGKYGYKKVDFYPKILQMNPDAIYQRCGSEIVTAIRKESMIYAILTVSHLSESKMKELKAKFSATASGISWGAKMNAEFNSLLKTSLASSQISIKINAIGGEGIIDLTELLGSSDSSNEDNTYIKYSKLPEVMSNYIKKMTKENSAPTEYYTTTISSLLAEQIPVPRYQDFKTKILQDLYFSYLDFKQIIDRATNLILTKNLSEVEQDELNKIIGICNTTNKDLLEAASFCFEEKSQKCMPLYKTIPYINWSKYDKVDENTPISKSEISCEKGRKIGLEKKYYGKEYYNELVKEGMGPIFQSAYDGEADLFKGKIVTYISCSNYPY